MGVFDRAVPLFNKALILVRVSECKHDKCAVGEGEGSKPHSMVVGVREDEAEGNGWCNV